MENYEISDVIGRASHPDLAIDFYFDHGLECHDLRFSRSGAPNAAGITPILMNHSNEPALYAVVVILVDKRLSALN